MQDNDAARHLPALDGVRGLAILTVMLLHQTVFVPQSALELGVYHALSVGWIGVDIFFVLSGFLITGILLDSRGDQHFFKSFYMRRAAHLSAVLRAGDLQLRDPALVAAARVQGGAVRDRR